MVHQWQVKGEPVTLQSTRRFYLRRFFRIAPLYYTVLIFTFAIQESFLAGYNVLRSNDPGRWMGDVVYDPARMSLDTTNFLMHVTFLFGLHPRFSFSTFLPDWSLSLEMQFYLIFPLLMISWQRIGPIRTTLAWFVACDVIARLLPVFPEPSPLPLKLHVFLVGMLAAEGVRVFPSGPRRSVAMILLACLIAPQDTRIVAGAAGIIFLAGVSDTSSRFRAAADALLDNRAVRFLAETSYAVYLVHGFWIALAGAWLFQQPSFMELKPWARVFVLIGVTALGSYAAAWFLYRYVERPGIAAGRAISSYVSVSPPQAGRGSAKTEPMAGDAGPARS
jgi:peptidoglycan/LPS O-acetylase OafA/YrhL